MKTVDEVYARLLDIRIVSVADMKEYSMERFGAGYGYFHKQYVQSFLKTGKLVRIKRGLYAAVNIFGDSEPDRYLIAAKLRPEYYIGYHTALELHGCAYSAYRHCYVAVNRSSCFRAFDFGGVRYSPVVQQNLTTGVDTVDRYGKTLRLSSPSRTFVDCLRRMELAGGLEECLKSLDGLRGVKFQSVETVLDMYDEEVLRRKTGFVLELLQKHSPYYRGVKGADLDRLASRVGKSTLYMEPGARSKRSRRWNLYVPRDIEHMLRGV